MTLRDVSTLAAGLAIAAAVVPARAQPRQRFVYAALPGVGGGNNLKYGGAGILVFDIDHGHKFVRRVPLQGKLGQGEGANNAQEAIKGIAAHAQTARLYVSTGRRVAAYDLPDRRARLGAALRESRH